MESQQTVDVLDLPQMALVTHVAAASLRTLARMLNTLADTIGQVEVLDDENEDMVDDKDDSLNSCQEKVVRPRCDTVTVAMT